MARDTLQNLAIEVEGIKKDILSKRCQKFASQFDWSVCGKKYLKLIKQLSSNKDQKVNL